MKRIRIRNTAIQYNGWLGDGGLADNIRRRGQRSPRCNSVYHQVGRKAINIIIIIRTFFLQSSQLCSLPLLFPFFLL